MRKFVCICILIAIAHIAKAQRFRQDAFGLVPLHSTRTDVERLYGISDDSCRCIFRTTTDNIEVAYASSPCAGFISGWNVPKDTVLSFKVTPYVPLLISDLAMDLNGFVRRSSPEDIVTTYYTNVKQGIVYAVQDRHVIYVRYFPPSNENGRRCRGFPPWDGVPPPRPFLTIFTQNKIDVYSRLDNFAIELSTNTQRRGYIITYAGKKSRRGEAKKMANDARRYLILKRMISPDQIIAVDGGFRETSQYDLFSLSPQEPPPTPTPTVASDEVKIIRL